MDFVNDFCPINRWQAVQEKPNFPCQCHRMVSQFLQDKRTGQLYLNDSATSIRWQCLQLIVATPLIHIFSAIRNLASLLSLYPIWKKIDRTHPYDFTCRMSALGRALLLLLTTPIITVLLLLAAFYGCFRPYDGRKLYASLERLHSHHAITRFFHPMPILSASGKGTEIAAKLLPYEHRRALFPKKIDKMCALRQTEKKNLTQNSITEKQKIIIEETSQKIELFYVAQSVYKKSIMHGINPFWEAQHDLFSFSSTLRNHLIEALRRWGKNRNQSLPSRSLDPLFFDIYSDETNAVIDGSITFLRSSIESCHIQFPCSAIYRMTNEYKTEQIDGTMKLKELGRQRKTSTKAALACYRFSGSTGIVGNTNGVIAPLGIVVFNKNSEKPTVDIVFKGSISGSHRAIAQALVKKSGNADWVSNIGSKKLTSDEFVCPIEGTKSSQSYIATIRTCLSDIKIIFSHIFSDLEQSKQQLAAVHFSGHSQGGGLATLAFVSAHLGQLAEMITTDPVRVSILKKAFLAGHCFAISSPKVCNLALKKALHCQFPDSHERIHRVHGATDLIVEENKKYHTSKYRPVAAAIQRVLSLKNLEIAHIVEDENPENLILLEPEFPESHSIEVIDEALHMLQDAPDRLPTVFEWPYPLDFSTVQGSARDSNLIIEYLNSHATHAFDMQSFVDIIDIASQYYPDSTVAQNWQSVSISLLAANYFISNESLPIQTSTADAFIHFLQMRIKTPLDQFCIDALLEYTHHASHSNGRYLAILRGQKWQKETLDQLGEASKAGAQDPTASLVWRQMCAALKYHIRFLYESL